MKTTKGKELINEYLDERLLPSYCIYQASDKGSCYDHIDFEDFPFEMQYGVYLQFFQEQGIIIDLQPVMDCDNEKYTKLKYWIINIVKLNTLINEDFEIETFEEAQKEAISKAEEILLKN